MNEPKWAFVNNKEELHLFERGTPKPGFQGDWSDNTNPRVLAFQLIKILIKLWRSYMMVSSSLFIIGGAFMKS